MTWKRKISSMGFDLKKTRFQIIIDGLLSPRYYPAFLFFITYLAYGIFIPFLGFYGDDFSLAWLAYKVGSLDPFFLIYRPILRQFFYLVTGIISPSVIQWHLVFTFIRYLLALQIFYLFRSIKAIDTRAPYWISLLFLIYPGALIFYQPVTFTTLFLVFIFLITSFWCTVKSMEEKKRSWIYVVLSLIFQVLNLITLEYFYFLDLLRYVIIWFGVSEKDMKTRLKKTLIKSAPFLVVFTVVSIYRIINVAQIVSYQPALIQDFTSNPFNAFLKLISNAGRDMFNLGIRVWISIFQPQVYLAQQGKTTSIFYLFLIAFSGIVMFYYFSRVFPLPAFKKEKLKKSNYFLVLVGLFALFLGGLSPWMANLETSIDPVIKNRFSLSFAPGAALLVSGLLLLSRKSKIPLIIIAMISAFSIGTHVLVANQFRYDWIEQKRFYWQMAWRFPTLSVPTTIIADHSTVNIGAENPISAAINWMYFHEGFGRTQNQAGYYLLYNEARIKAELNDLQTPLPPMNTGLIGRGSYEQYHLLALENYQGCMRVLDPLTSPLDESLPAYLKRAVVVSDLNCEYIDDPSHPALMDPNIFGPEPQHEWCYYFQKADLARSRRQWAEMLQLKSTAEQKGYFPQNAQEKMVFLYAHIGSGDYQSALALSRELSAEGADHTKMICKIWEKMGQEQLAIPLETRNIVVMEFSCSS